LPEETGNFVTLPGSSSAGTWALQFAGLNVPADEEEDAAATN